MSGSPPVLLLAGPGSKRLEALALEEAARVICRGGGHPADPDCPDCRRIFRPEDEKLRAKIPGHPDLLVAAPERRRRVNVPAFEEGDTKETTIPTALVRAIAAESTRLPYEAQRRAIVLLDVDRTEPAAFSALLKILEEPPSKTRFLLTATRPRLLPPTILSRVTLRAAPASSRGETAAALRARGLPEEEAVARAAFRPSDVEEAAGLGLKEARDLRDGLLAALSGVYLVDSVSWALALAALVAEKDGAEAVERLGLVALLLRDAAAAAVDPAGQNVVHRERFADLARLGSVAASRLLDGATAALALAASLSESSRNVRLAAEAFALGMLENTVAAGKPA